MYPQNVNEVAFNLLDSHDTARVLTMAEGNKERIKLLYLFQLSFIGSPCIYYGDEIGMTGGGDPGCRKCMEWDQSKQDHDLYQFIKQLLMMRKEISAFGNRADFKFLQVEEEVVAYLKHTEKSSLAFVLNNSELERTVTVDALSNLKVKEIFTGEEITLLKKQMLI